MPRMRNLLHLAEASDIGKEALRTLLSTAGVGWTGI
jgi:hypothetical protein